MSGRANTSGDEVTRRAFLRTVARSCLGVSALPFLGGELLAGAGGSLGPATARSVVFLYLRGGFSHIDTFDLKPGTAEQGPTEARRTAADGVRIASGFERLAARMDDVCVVNSMVARQGAHVPARYFLHTAQERAATVRHPSLGAWLSHFAGPANPALPPHVQVGDHSHTSSAGFLEPRHGPLPISDPTRGLQDATLAEGVTEETLRRRLSLLAELDREFVRDHDSEAVRAHGQAYDRALALMRSRDLAAFDLSLESEALRDAYGRTTLGQGALLARRLVEHGVRFVEVVSGGWDTHVDNFGELARRVPELDAALATLLADLSARGMLEETLVVVTTEFGRSPRIVASRTGRDHHPSAFSTLLAGGGIRGGRTHGRTDATATEVIEDPVTIPDLHATIGFALGLPFDDEVEAPSGRSFRVAGGGRPVRSLFT